MVSHPEMAAMHLARQIANTMYITKSTIPLQIRNQFYSIMWFDLYTQKTESFWKLIALEYLKILSKKMDLKVLKSYLVVDEKIKCHIWQHDFQIDGVDFIATTAGNTPYPSHPLSALVDCIFSFEVENGCERCGFSEEGCEACAFNKARRLLNNSETVTTFRKTGHKFFEALGEERSESLLDLVRDFNMRLANAEEMDEDEWNENNPTNLDEEIEEPDNLVIDEQEVWDHVNKDMDDGEGEG